VFLMKTRTALRLPITGLEHIVNQSSFVSECPCSCLYRCYQPTEVVCVFMKCFLNKFQPKFQGAL
jgi:hypothetical protein